MLSSPALRDANPITAPHARIETVGTTITARRGQSSDAPITMHANTTAAMTTNCRSAREWPARHALVGTYAASFSSEGVGTGDSARRTHASPSFFQGQRASGGE